MDEVYLLEQELNLLDAKAIRFHRDAFDDLVMEQGEERFAGVQVLRGFPHSDAGRMISVRDSEGEELGIIAGLAEVDRDSGRLLEEELERVYFVPHITQVNDVVERFHVPKWNVETDRGHREFEIRSGRNDVRVLGGGRILLRDADGNHYEILDYRRLDAASQNLIESQI